MKNFLYWLLNASSFVQLKNKKVFGISNLFLAFSIAGLIAAIPIGMKWDYDASFPFAVPFILLGIVFCFWKLLIGVVPKEIQDRHPLTQLVRFKDPSAWFQNMKYPGDAKERERQTEQIWEATFGVKYEDTIAPWLQLRRIAFLPVLAVIGLWIGMLLR